MPGTAEKPASHSLLHRDIARLVLASILALGMVFGVPRAHAEDELPARVGRMADVGGEIFLAPQDAPEQWNIVGLNYPVAEGDNLWVGKDSRAEIDFGGGQFRLSGETSLHMSRLDERNFALFVAQGTVILRVRTLEPGDSARIDTPNVQVTLTRPGLYRIDVAPDGLQSLVAVREGEAAVDTGASLQQVLPGQSATMEGNGNGSGNGSGTVYVQLRNGIGNDAFDTWNAARDRHYERGRANAPVSRQMVGYSDLDDYGTWEPAPEYGGTVWYPANVAADWAPYSVGYWTEVGNWGPTWVDAAPWGYAPFHYGRWSHIRGRWGWCPGAYVARPVWAPALVGWVGGPGWRVGLAGSAPVYGWVPLGWGESYQPHWRRCSDGCWARYNKPYAVNVTVRIHTPPAQYANQNAPRAVTAISAPAFSGRRPVQNNLVAVNTAALATAPVLAAPPARLDARQLPAVRPGMGMPQPASTVQAATSRPPRNSPDAVPQQGFQSAPIPATRTANVPPPSSAPVGKAQTPTQVPAPTAGPNPGAGPRQQPVLTSSPASPSQYVVPAQSEPRIRPQPVAPQATNPGSAPASGYAPSVAVPPPRSAPKTETRTESRNERILLPPTQPSVPQSSAPPPSAPHYAVPQYAVPAQHPATVAPIPAPAPQSHAPAMPYAVAPQAHPPEAPKVERPAAPKAPGPGDAPAK